MITPSSPWMPRFTTIHLRALVVCLGSAVFASSWIALIDGPALAALLALGVAIFGVPHGALDLTLVRGMGIRSRRELIFITTGYIALSLCVLILWILVPVSTLSAFLLISLLHFGWGDTESLRGAQRWLEVAVRGGLPIAAPIAFHPETTRDLFIVLTGSASVETVERLMTLAAPVCLLWAAFLLAAVGVRLYQGFRYTREHLWAAGELAGLLCIFYLLHPLAAFLIYFCAAHSVRHLADLASARHPRSPRKAAEWIVLEALPLSLLTVLLAAVLGLTLGFSSDRESVLVRIVFQGLAALTLPHMLLTAIWHRAGEPRPGSLFTRSS